MMKVIIIIILFFLHLVYPILLKLKDSKRNIGFVNVSENVLYIVNIPRLWSRSRKTLGRNTFKPEGEITELHILEYYDDEKSVEKIHALPQLMKISVVDVQYDNDIIFSNLPKINSIKIRRTDMKRIRHQIFSSLDVTELFLSENEIDSIEDKSFGTRLETLDLKCNYLEEIRSEWFQDVGRLKKLSFEANRLSYIPERLFENFRSLSKISLDLNMIETIGDLAFSGRNSFAWITLGYNRLTELRSSIFKNENITTASLELQFNNLTYIPKELMSRVKVSGTTNIDGNPWRCSCYLKYILPWISWELYGHLDEGWPQDRSDEPRCVVSKKYECVEEVDNDDILFYIEHSTPTSKSRDGFCDCLENEEHSKCLYGYD